MNDFNTGKKIFKQGTNFDFYVIENTKRDETFKTEVNDIYNKTSFINFSDWKFIPGAEFEKFSKILAHDGASVDVMYDRTMYGADKQNMSFEEGEYPCCYTITKRVGMKLMYSNVRKGHFGVPKVIWSNGLGTYPVIDETGEFGLTSFSYAISDTLENLEKIKYALETREFVNLMNSVKFTNNKYNYKIISLFKKDFWKEFL